MNLNRRNALLSRAAAAIDTTPKFNRFDRVTVRPTGTGTHFNELGGAGYVADATLRHGLIQIRFDAIEGRPSIDQMTSPYLVTLAN